MKQLHSLFAITALSGLLEVAPQFGLVPLRADPESGLWEFWHVPSGERPNPDPETGAWRVEPRTGIVLVLLPGGPFRVGPTTLSEESPLFDPWIYELQSENERQNFDIAVDPFFISKYELTQAQWYHVRRSNPSKYTASPIHPVESVSWIDCEETMRRLDLVLPTEAQWEYACRGGMDTRYYTGQNMNSLVGHANLRYTWNAEGDEIPWQDDHENHAPVGSYLPNPYGLYDVHGNVWEWCRDYYDRYGAPRDGDGLRTPDPDDLAGVFKGGSFGGTPYDARVTRRYDWYRKNSEPDTGLRPARPLVND